MIVLIGRGPLGAGMEEVYQLTSALKYLDGGTRVALLTDARFSGVSTGACIGHIGPEALAGGPIGKIRDGDRLRVVIDRTGWKARIDLLEPDADGDGCAGRRGACAAARRARIWRADATCRPRRASGPRCRTSAAAPGAGVSTTSTRSLLRCEKAHRDIGA